MNPIKKIVSGELLQKGGVVKNLPFLMYVTFLMVLYISYGYYVDNTVSKIIHEEKNGEELYSELQTVLELYDQESLQSKVAEKTEKWGLYESKDPPVIIDVDEKFLIKSE